MQARASAASIIRLVVRSASCSVCMASSASGTIERISALAAIMSCQFRIALLRHGRAPDGAGRHRFLHLAEPDLAAGRGHAGAAGPGPTTFPRTVTPHFSDAPAAWQDAKPLPMRGTMP
jgi:hypothetical protein